MFPEIKEAMDALERRVKLTEAEIAQMKEGIKAKKAQVKSWRKPLAAFTPKRAGPKSNRTAAAQHGARSSAAVS